METEYIEEYVNTEIVIEDDPAEDLSTESELPEVINSEINTETDLQPDAPGEAAGSETGSVVYVDTPPDVSFDVSMVFVCSMIFGIIVWSIVSRRWYV